LKPGDICPECKEHKLYEMPPITKVKLIGSAPVQAIKFILERSGCVCGTTFSGEVPAEFGELEKGPKFSPSAMASIIHQKVDLGVPYGALAALQKNVGVPVPASTLVNKIQENEEAILAVSDVLEKQGANRDLIGFDDTKIKILEGRIMEDGKKSIQGQGSAFFCNNIDQKNPIILYRFDFEHAGKYIMNLSKLRVDDLPPPNYLCDGLLCYEAYTDDGVLNNCNAHSRRKFFLYDPKATNHFCTLIVNFYKEIYKNNKFCKELKRSPEERQIYHATHSAGPLGKIKLTCQFITSPPDDPSLPDLRKKLNLPEYIIPSPPNSDLHDYGKYVLRRWEALTNFTRIPGIPLDTNYVEIKIKAIIEIRVKGLFFKTLKSAIRTGKILSVIETAKENGINSFAYFEFLIRHKEEVKKAPEHFLPWNYQEHILFKIRPPLSIRV
jgi:hypothetical protein